MYGWLYKLFINALHWQVLQKIRGEEDIDEEFQSIKHNCEQTEQQRKARGQ